MKIKPSKSFTVYLEQTARMLRTEASTKLRGKKVGKPPDVSLANKVEQVAKFLRSTT